jgi:hypothetical protein
MIALLRGLFAYNINMSRDEPPAQDTRVGSAVYNSDRMVVGSRLCSSG